MLKEILLKKYMNQIKLREEINLIKNNKDLSYNEKNKLIQKLMSPTNVITNKICDHYEKKCGKFYFECCDTTHNCRRCHNEDDQCLFVNHKLKTIICDECNTEQVPSNKCINCSIKFANNYCEKCFIWTSKNIIHCDACGFCRLTENKQLHHCFDCNACFFDKEHFCLKENISNKQCCICLESVHHSQKKYITMDCCHQIHTECITNGVFSCGFCKKSIFDMIQHWKYLKKLIKLQPLPDEYNIINIGDTVYSPYGLFEVISQNNNMFFGKLNMTSNTTATFNKKCLKKLVKIYCNDCQKNNWSPFHFIGLECLSCGSFNTSK
jgi:RING finger/CHY zinc finger protein 1